MDNSGQTAYLMIEIRDVLREIAGSLEKIASQSESNTTVTNNYQQSGSKSYSPVYFRDFYGSKSNFLLEDETPLEEILSELPNSEDLDS